MHHVGFIVKDMDRALEYYRCLGIDTTGPEFTLKVKSKKARIKIKSVRIGSVEMEFLEPVEGETMQSDFLNKHGEGIQHLAFVVEDLDKEVDELVGQGVKLMFKQDLSDGSKYAYFDIGKIGDLRLELVQLSQGDKTPGNGR